MSTKNAGGFSEQERTAMKQRAVELTKETQRGRGSRKAADELEVLAKLAEMEPADRVLAERIHVLVTAAAPELASKLWYGQPAYAKGGKVVCFFRSGADDKERYSTFGFTPEARLDDGGVCGRPRSRSAPSTRLPRRRSARSSRRPWADAAR